MNKKSPPTFRNCEQCAKSFLLIKPSARNRFCGHKCAFAKNGHLARQAAEKPDVIARRGDILRGRGDGKAYTKRNGRHEHRIIAEQIIGRPLKKGEVVHHRDHNKKNNDPSNLQVFASNGEHSRVHNIGKKYTPKTHCKNGHIFTDESTMITWAGNRRCLICNRAYDAAWKKRKRKELKP